MHLRSFFVAYRTRMPSKKARARQRKANAAETATPAQETAPSRLELHTQRTVCCQCMSTNNVALNFWHRLHVAQQDQILANVRANKAFKRSLRRIYKGSGGFPVCENCMARVYKDVALNKARSLGDIAPPKWY